MGGGRRRAWRGGGGGEELYANIYVRIYMQINAELVAQRLNEAHVLHALFAIIPWTILQGTILLQG